MIQPVNALAPKVLYKGQIENSKAYSSQRTKRNLAVVNAAGTSAVVAAVMMAISRSYTSSWHQAGAIGGVIGAVTMMFLTPHLLFKASAGKRANKSGDIFAKESVSKKLINEAFDPAKYSKNIMKKVA